MKKNKVLLIGLSGFFLIGIFWALSSPSIESHVSRKVINSPKAIAWSIIADVANYHHYAKGLTEVDIISGSGKGMVRSCSNEQSTWKETCTQWDENNSYSFNVHTEENFPFPFDVFNGTWAVKEINKEETEIIVTFNYQFSQRWMSWFYSEDTHKHIEEGNTALLSNWSKKISEKNMAQNIKTDK